MNVLLNILWLICGGLVSAAIWFFAGMMMVVTIVGIPWARATFNIAILALWPFGSKVVSRAETAGDIGTGEFGVIGNVIWFILAGWWLFIYHLGCAVVTGVTIIGIPFALQYWKLAKISIAPIGKTIT